MAENLSKETIAKIEALLQAELWQRAREELNLYLSVYPDHPHLQLLQAKLAYAQGNSGKAEEIFRQLLKTSIQPQILNQARQGLRQIEADALARRQQRMAEIADSEAGQTLGFLALLPVDAGKLELHSQLVTRLARILRTDVYTAKFQLPTRHLKIIRVGTMANLQAYGEELQQAGIPCVWLSLQAVANIQVAQVQYFQPLGLGEVRAVCEKEEWVFTWEQVTARVEGVLPTYSGVIDVEVGLKYKIIRREQELDRIRICDLHLPSENLILRFHDSAYKFQQGMQLAVRSSLPHLPPTVHERWQAMMSWFSETQPQIPVHNNFPQFSDMLKLHPTLLKEVNPRVNISRPKPQIIDNCFELFSAIIFLTHNCAHQSVS
ncbi:MAG: tetratricopeptide repeat protein [Pseudanabaenaceae cyanobacterium]